jgi:hypothetical protein
MAPNTTRDNTGRHIGSSPATLATLQDLVWHQTLPVITLGDILAPPPLPGATLEDLVWHQTLPVTTQEDILAPPPLPGLHYRTLYGTKHYP